VEFLLDSVILIDHFNDISEATAYLEEVAVSPIESHPLRFFSLSAG